MTTDPLDAAERLNEEDLASRLEDQARTLALARVQRNAGGGEGLTPGTCGDCRARISDVLRWCDADCRADWLKRLGREVR